MIRDKQKKERPEKATNDANETETRKEKRES
jgi:hypothetical protein